MRSESAGTRTDGVFGLPSPNGSGAWQRHIDARFTAVTAGLQPLPKLLAWFNERQRHGEHL
jgi:hypothetical protein